MCVPCGLLADDSGRWGKGGLFSALSSRSTCPQAQYEEAGRMRDLAAGDAHIVTLDDRISREDGRDLVSCTLLLSLAGPRHDVYVCVYVCAAGFGGGSDSRQGWEAVWHNASSSQQGTGESG